jgi:hypothetical protein
MEIDILDELHMLLKMVDLDGKYYIHTNVIKEDRKKDTYILLKINNRLDPGGMFTYLDAFATYELLSKRIHEIVNERMLGDH